jgi:hypothetical protein
MSQRNDILDAGREPFFVGYLATPPKLSRFLVTVALGAIGIAAAVALPIALLQRNPGSGTWHADETQTFEGVFHLRPYPLLQPSAASGGDTLLLVDQGKHSVAPALAAFDGRPVSIRGQLLEREGLKMIELAEVADPVQAAQSTGIALTADPDAQADAVPVVLRGEIVDPKCFSGAMKPGDGKTHKACAALCLRGGIPPVLVQRGADGVLVYHVLVSHSGGPLGPAELAKVIAVVGEPVELSGTVETRGGMRLLKADLESLRRR